MQDQELRNLKKQVDQLQNEMNSIFTILRQLSDVAHVNATEITNNILLISQITLQTQEQMVEINKRLDHHWKAITFNN